MLPPQLAGGSLAVRRHSIATTSSLSSSSSSPFRSASASQARSLFGWGKGRYDDWSSPMDPSYHRYAKYHTVKSRAKLLKSLKRRSKFEWDCNQRPFFSPRHIRFASNFNRGGPGSTWNQFARNQSNNQQARAQEKPTRDDKDSNEGYELSQREKEWKERMEFMRKRIEQDPYEAVFGKRFEPFWSPLVPSWMREEMGLRGSDRYKPRTWDKNATPRVEPQDHQRDLQDIHQVKQSLESQPSQDRQDTAAKREHKDDPGLSYGTDLWPESKADLLSTRKDATDDPGLSATAKAQPPSKSEPAPKASAGTSSPRNYASSDSTSWNSWTNKTYRTEWDSASGKVKRFEYDPVTNRCVQIEGPLSSQGREINLERCESDDYNSAVAGWTATKQPSSNETPSLPTRPGDMRSLINTPSGDVVNTSGRVSNADKQSSGSQASPTRPAALVNMPKDDIDLLTADNVRASMGKTRKLEGPSKATKTAERTAMNAKFDNPTSEHDAEVDDMIRERELAKFDSQRPTKQAKSQWDAAEEEVMLERQLQSLTWEKAKLIRGERSAYHFERNKKEVIKLDGQMAELKGRLDRAKAKSQQEAVEERVLLECELQSLTWEKAKLLRGERSAYHFERNKREVIKLDGQIAELKRRLDPDTTTSKPSRKIVDLDRKPGQTSNSAPATEPSKSADKLQTSLDRNNQAAEKLRPMTLQPSVDRLQSGKPIRDLDDSAAHESTEPMPTPISNAVPAGWSDAADRLQADRVRRMVSNKPYHIPPHGLKPKPQPQPTKAELEKRSRKEKANALLNAEVNDQKSKMAAHEDRLKEKASRSPEEEFRIQTGLEEELAKFKTPISLTEEEKRIQQLEAELAKTRMLAVDASTGKPATEAVRDERKYVDKIRNLRAELDVAYKQSSVHAEEYMHRINGLETKLAKYKETPTAVREHDMPEHDVPRTPNKSPKSANEGFDADKAKYVDKIKSLRQELDRTFKQSAVQGEKHIERIRYLESELAKSRQHSTAPSATSSSKSAKSVGSADTKAKEVQAEGDFDPKICDFAAADGGKWYKQPTCPPQPSKEELVQAEQKARDRALVDEVKGIYEQRYGTIDVEHRQARDSEPKSREELQDKRFMEDPRFINNPAWEEALEKYKVRGNWYLSEKQKAREAEIAARREKEGHQTQVSSTSVQDKKIVDDASPKLIPTGLANQENEKATTPEVSPVSAIEWEYPPLYKVLAYDSGNDKFSTATTITPAFSGATVETPISIPQALSQLYQPARFVPHFAELQREGFQVIHGTRDLLVFKKVKTANDTSSVKEADAASSGQASLVDHGLIKPKENGMAEDAANFYGQHAPRKNTGKGYDSTSLESGKILVPYENALAQEAAQAYDENAAASTLSKRSPTVNPIDGSSGLSGGTPLSEVSTGNFASPTGFVNHDPVFSSAEGGPKDDFGGAVVEGANTKLKSARAQAREFDHGGAGGLDSSRTSPAATSRVRREEPDFSGSKKRWNERHERHHRRSPRSQYHRKRGGLFGWVVKVGVSAAAVSYVIGVAAESSRQDVRERERLRGIVEGRTGR